MVRIIIRSFKTGFLEIWSHKLRSTLSFFGVFIGVLCIMTVFASVDSLERNISGSINSLGNDVVYVQKWPWDFGEGYPWWEYMNRPEVSEDEYLAIRSRVRSSKAICYLEVIENQKAISSWSTMDGVNLVSVSEGYENIRSLQVTSGRFLSQREFHNGEPVAILGGSIALELFPRAVSAIGQKIKVNQGEVRIIGVLQEEGQDILNLSLDNDIIVSNAYINKTMGRETFGSPLIMAKVKEDQTMDEAKAELAFLMRSVRYQNIQSKDDFAINETSLLANAFTKVFEVVNQAGLFIGIFSILVGGIGILNIMLVSVRERRAHIGIKKALGAKRYVIMLEFLIEAVMLCLIGGGLGMAASYAFLNIANLFIAQSGASIVLSLSDTNIILGFGLSTAIGLLAGAIPAYLGASLDPVKAIRKI